MSLMGFFSNLPWFGNSSKLCAACQEGDLATVRGLATPELVNTIGWMGWAPLHKAAQMGNSEIVEYLLVQPDLKTDVNIRDTDNHTPLILACGNTKANTTEKHIKSIHLLLAGGANVNAEDDGGYSALDLAVINDNLEAVKLLLEYKCNVNHQNQDHFTPLHSACRYQYQEIAALLVAAGADLSIPDGQGRTPIQLAQRYGVILALASPVLGQTQATTINSSTSNSVTPPPPVTPLLPPNATPNSQLADLAVDDNSKNHPPKEQDPDGDKTLELQAELEAAIQNSGS